MKGYSYSVEPGKEDIHALARIEDVDASYKDLSEVCGRITRKGAGRALEFLKKAEDMEVPVYFASHNKKLGHRHELGGKKGRYPWKAAKVVRKALESAMANARVKGMTDDLIVVHASANRKHSYGRVASKGRWARSDYETSRVEIVLREKNEGAKPKNVEVRAPKKDNGPKAETPKSDAPKAEAQKKQASKKQPKAAEKTEQS